MTADPRRGPVVAALALAVLLPACAAPPPPVYRPVIVTEHSSSAAALVQPGAPTPAAPAVEPAAGPRNLFPPDLLAAPQPRTAAAGAAPLETRPATPPPEPTLLRSTRQPVLASPSVPPEPYLAPSVPASPLRSAP